MWPSHALRAPASDAKERPCQPIQSPDNYHVNFPLANVFHHFRQRRPIILGSALTVIAVQHTLPASTLTILIDFARSQHYKKRSRTPSRKPGRSAGFNFAGGC
jgi:hypothetical protein